MMADQVQHTQDEDSLNSHDCLACNTHTCCEQDIESQNWQDQGQHDQDDGPEDEGVESLLELSMHVCVRVNMLCHGTRPTPN